MDDYDADEVARVMRTEEYVSGLIQTLMDGTSNEALIEELVECVDIASDQTNLPEIAKLANKGQVAFADQAEAAGEDLTADNPNNW